MNSFPIPNEVLERILTFCRPCDIASFSASCRVAYSMVYEDPYQHIWRQLFLAHPFDDPRKSCPDERSTINWRVELIRRLKAEQTALNPNRSREVQAHALQVFQSAILNAPARRHASGPSSSDLHWIERILRHSTLLNHNSHESNIGRSSYSRLRSHLALFSELQANPYCSRNTSRHRRNCSRLFVYSMHNYIGKRYWGPFTDEGLVDWEHVEHLVNVSVYNLLDLPRPWRAIVPPPGLEATRKWSAPDVPISGHDWAGVEGTWRRYVFYMDYRDLFAFNYSVLTGGQPDPSFFDCPRFREATRLLEIDLRVVEKHQLTEGSLRAIERQQMASISDSRWPTLYYSGSVKGLDGINATIEGLVQMGVDGVVRWQFINDYSDHGEWGAEGVQIGNIASAMGIVGVWTTPYHDDAGDPIGPFWMWKVENGSETILMDFAA